MNPSELLLPPEPHQWTSVMLLIDIGCWTQVRRGVSFWPIWHPVPGFFRGKSMVFTHVLLQWCLIISRTPKDQKICSLERWVIWCGHLAVKTWDYAWSIRHSLCDGLVTRSGAVENLQAWLHLDAELETSPSRRPYPHR